MQLLFSRIAHQHQRGRRALCHLRRQKQAQTDYSSPAAPAASRTCPAWTIIALLLRPAPAPATAAAAPKNKAPPPPPPHLPPPRGTSAKGHATTSGENPPIQKAEKNHQERVFPSRRVGNHLSHGHHPSFSLASPCARSPPPPAGTKKPPPATLPIAPPERTGQSNQTLKTKRNGKPDRSSVYWKKSSWSASAACSTSSMEVKFKKCDGRWSSW